MKGARPNIPGVGARSGRTAFRSRRHAAVVQAVSPLPPFGQAVPVEHGRPVLRAGLAIGIALQRVPHDGGVRPAFDALERVNIAIRAA